MKASKVIAFPTCREAGRRAEATMSNGRRAAAKDPSASPDEINRQAAPSDSEAGNERVFLHRFHQASNLRDWYLHVGDDEKWRRVSDKMAEALRYGVSYVVIPSGLELPAAVTGLELLTVGVETFSRQIKQDWDATEA